MFETYQNYREAWDNAYTTTPKIPLNIDIELASLCNLRCPMCFYGEAEWNKTMAQKSWDDKPKKRIMPTLMAGKIIDDAASIGVPALKFNWRGESTIHPEYSKILTYAAAKIIRSGPAFFDLLVNTNANCKPEAIDGLMAATKCMVSLDTTLPEIYKIQRAGGNLDLAISVIKELIKRGHPNLWIRRVVTKENCHENFKENVDKIFGGKGYFVAEHQCMDRGDGAHQTHNPLSYERTYCGYPSQRIMVASDGLCYPCCVDTNGEMPIGNIMKQSIKQIWDGEPMRKLRDELKQNDFKSEICKKCESWMAYKAPQRESVQDKKL
jgi:radical SAM protein with 4Fe4S-binding SPASM domain